MHDLSKSKKRQVFGACMAGASIIKVVEMLVFLRATILRTMTE